MGLIICCPAIALNVSLLMLMILTMPIRFILNTIIGKRNLNALIKQIFGQTQTFNTQINNNDDGESNTLCIVTWNLYSFCDRFWLRQHIVLQELMSHDPDIICCQEAVSSLCWSNVCTLTQVGTSLSKTFNCVYHGFSFNGIGCSLIELPVTLGIFVFGILTDIVNPMINSLLTIPFFGATFHHLLYASSFSRTMFGMMTCFWNT
eukprot:929606_1